MKLPGEWVNENEEKIWGIGALLGAISGLVIGFMEAGIGGAIVGVVIGGVVGASILILVINIVLPTLGCSILLIAIVAIFAIINMLWGVGR